MQLQQACLQSDEPAACCGCTCQVCPSTDLMSPRIGNTCASPLTSGNFTTQETVPKAPDALFCVAINMCDAAGIRALALYLVLRLLLVRALIP